MEGMITVERLSKKYGSKLAVDDLSFTVPDGVVTGFLGPNGSGKSTTMRCMLGLDAPTTGQALFTGTDSQGNTYSNQPFSTLKNKPSVAGAILDATWHNKARSGRAHLRALARGAGIPDTRVEECLEQVGMTEAAKDKVGGYSLGMKQRLGVAAALLGKPQHLILDEPVNGLDPEGVSWMRHTIKALAAQGCAVLVSSHLLSEMQLTADRIVVIGRGRMIGEYSMDEFLADGTVVEVEVDDPARLLQALGPVARGVDVDKQLCIPLNDGISEQQLRRDIAAAALREGLLVTRLNTKRDNLEEKFLAATQDSQEYRAQAIGQ
ncbi:ABC transporter ATP-binding protein [Corynebacterium amycolatum]|uniref:ABC transporter ATP-binding protein n=1 Tax=Corynebacterium amycolatum TaxID=43765 RepID=A0AB37GBX4_CORAY|nr:ABC transporter ATP-binding protein [Corynebacterium amycolatum]MCQ9167693.1 ABC transporter ATP-binding protein [Corynebacterium amycolatum]MCQ9173072.1 ABC transporter ATP-binding protein [Corynebacterium amycolatum]QPR31498.1 ABC transporter ATP-binding protein [Corynebacterium amycolatum]QQB83379.1 ABC transporter ATP-binding protein [Corynebacterium amycolatum]QQV00940.1 ABC transporter ATP-binding protein [Corynebacterium amycolatum]